MLAEWMDKIEEEIVEVNCCISEPQAQYDDLLGSTQERILHYVCRAWDASLLYTQMLSALPRKGGVAFPTLNCPSTTITNQFFFDEIGSHAILSHDKYAASGFEH